MAKKLKPIRMSEEVETLLNKLCTKRDATQAAIVEEGIRLLAAKEKVTVTLKSEQGL